MRTGLLILPALAWATAAYGPSGANALTGSDCGGDTSSAEVSCSFSWGPSQLTVKVTAKDKSDGWGAVYAWGKAQCGNGQASCRELDSCIGTDTTTKSGDGNCSAGTEEWWHNGFIDHCKATPDRDNNCWLSNKIPEIVCPPPLDGPNPPCEGLGLVVPEDTLEEIVQPPCPAVAFPTFTGVPHDARVMITVTGVVVPGFALAEICSVVAGCHIVQPVCSFVVGDLRCSAGYGSRLMASDLLVRTLELA